MTDFQITNGVTKSNKDCISLTTCNVHFNQLWARVVRIALKMLNHPKMQQVALWISRRAYLSQKIRDVRYKFMNDLQIFQHCGMSSYDFWSIKQGQNSK